MFANKNRVLAQLELDFNSVERIVEYLDVPQEAPAVIEQCRPPAYWPSSNEGLIIENLIVRYAPDLPPALKGITIHVKPSEKIGVVIARRMYSLVLVLITFFCTGWEDRIGYEYSQYLLV